MATRVDVFDAKRSGLVRVAGTVAQAIRRAQYHIDYSLRRCWRPIAQDDGSQDLDRAFQMDSDIVDVLSHTDERHTAIYVLGFGVQRPVPLAHGGKLKRAVLVAHDIRLPRRLNARGLVQRENSGAS